MRWKEKESPKLGSFRTIRRFLWFPTYLGNGEWRWLEFARIRQVFAITVRSDGVCMYKVCRWLDHSWDDGAKPRRRRKVSA